MWRRTNRWNQDMAKVEMPTLRRDQCREVDRRLVEDYGIPSVVLMENAGRGAAELLRSLGAKGPVAICCGSGNNAGDGFVIARHLDLEGIPVRVCLWTEPSRLQGDAAVNFRIVERSGLPLQVFGAVHDRRRLLSELAGADWVVDALLGTGARGEPRSPLAEVIGEINAQGLPVFAVDVPSGLDCDTGRPSATTIRARHTATFVAAKPGFSAAPAADYVGELHVLPIGVPTRLIEAIIAKSDSSGGE